MSEASSTTADGSNTVDRATLGGGCFWCLEPVFDDLRGVVSVESGYAGGQAERPTYEQVCSGRTGHAEVVQVVFNPQEVSYRDLLRVFFAIHDPTTLNRQGADVGTQYRSIILYHNEEQRRVAEEVIKELDNSHTFNDPIVTQVVPLETFYPAESYHQEYYANNPLQPYCNIVIGPKISKFRKQYANMLKTAPAGAV